MYRGLIVGALAFAAAFAAERVITNMAADIARYNKMRAMSGMEPIGKELFKLASSILGSHGSSNAVADLTNDVVRYARMKGM